MFIGIDIGGTSTRVGLFSSLDAADFSLIAHFPTLQSYEAELQALVSTIHSHTTLSPAGIGVSIGGRLAKDGRSVQGAPNLPAYVDQPFAHDLETQFSCPVRLAHDTVCGLLGEKLFGILRQETRCAYLTLSTGTGAAVHLHPLFISIEFGHQILDQNPLTCLCGQVGCLETHTGGRQLELRLGHSTKHITDPIFWQAFCHKLSWGLVNLVQLMRVEALAVSGSIALHNAFLLPLLQQRVDERLHGASLTLCPAIQKENAPLIGAASLLTLPDNAIVH